MDPKARRVWREGFAPFLSTDALDALRMALGNDDPRLIQGMTILPIPWDKDAPPAARCGCPIAYAGMATGHTTCAQAEAFYTAACEACDAKFSEPTMCRYFLQWIDNTPRHIAFRELYEEIELELSRRAAGTVAA